MADRRRRRRRRRRLRRPRQFRERLDIDNYDDWDLFDKFRFRRQTIIYILTLITPYIERPTRRGHCISPMLQFLAALRYFATGGHMSLIADSLGLSQPSVSRAVKRVAVALLRFAQRFIRFPTRNEHDEVKRAFFNLAGFPNILSVVDGTFIRIRAPVENEPDYINRKGFHSLNVQMACDAKFRITNCVSSWPGSVHDSRVFRNSELCRQFETGEHNGILLGDSGYACRHFLMTPFAAAVTPAQVRYNRALCRTRVVVEQTFGILKRRFNCLHVGMNVSPNTAALYTVCCAILHNIGIEQGDILQFDVDNQPAEEPVPAPVIREREDGHAMRNLICNTVFGNN